MGYISDKTIREVNERLDPVSLVGDYVRLEKRGGRYWGLCPFHNEKTPSFSVDPDRKMYYCFGCHEGGGMISFLMTMDKLSFPEAVETLAKRLGVELIYENTGDQPQDRGKTTRMEELAELYRRVAGSFHHLLMESPQGKGARDYILERGIDPGMIDRFRLGYAPADRNWLFQFLSHKGYTEPFLAQSGLFSKNNPRLSFFGDRLMFPIADRQGRTVAFGGRILSAEGPKYLNSSESEIYKKGETLFAIDLALPEIRKSREVYLAEGYMDVIALHQAGIGNAAAPLGTAFTDGQAKLLRRWAERIILVFDADEAGRNAAVKAILTCRRNGLACSVVASEGDGEENYQKFKDPADILKERGPETLQKRVKCFINDFEYLLIHSKALYDTSDSEGKARAVAFLFPYVEALDSEISREACMERIADTFRVEVQAVRDDYRHFDARRQSEPKKGPVPPQSPGPGQKAVRMNDELFLLVAVVVNPGFYPRLRAVLSIEEFEDPNAKELFIALEEWYRNDAPGMDDLLSRINSGGVRNFVVERGTSEAFRIHPEQLISDGIKRITQKRLERRRAEIVLELRSMRNEGTGSRSADLLSEKVYIDTELHRFKDSNK
ncbi:MAG: DNA primase [Spirochaetaceae bacterium]|jgi:DNA primase|nr:DNA primase [Spirochaetaceae bacterium]